MKPARLPGRGAATPRLGELRRWRKESAWTPRRLGARVPAWSVSTFLGDPDEVTVGTTDPDKVTVWLGAAGATDLTRRDAEELAALLLRAVRQLGG